MKTTRKLTKQVINDNVVGEMIYLTADRHGMHVRDMVRRPELLATVGVTPALNTPGAAAVARGLEVAADERIATLAAAFNAPRPVWPAGYAHHAPRFVRQWGHMGWPIKRVHATLRALGWAMDPDDVEWEYTAGRRAKTPPLPFTEEDVEYFDNLT